VVSRILIAIGALVLAVPLVLCVIYRPDRAIRTATASVADVICAKAFVSGLDPDAVFCGDAGPSRHSPPAGMLRYRLDRAAKTVDASVMGFLTQPNIPYKSRAVVERSSLQGRASARDWAKFGLLYLNDGVVGDKRILHEDWVDFCAAATLDTDYGAGFFTNRSEHDYAKGRVCLGIRPATLSLPRARSASASSFCRRSTWRWCAWAIPSTPPAIFAGLGGWSKRRSRRRRGDEVRHSGAMQCIEPGISRFRIWC